MPLAQWLSSDNKGATGSSFFCIKDGLYLGKYHLTTFTVETSLSPDKLLLLTLEPPSANRLKLIYRLTDPVTKVDNVTRCSGVVRTQGSGSDSEFQGP